jgi:hypothetical protein
MSLFDEFSTDGEAAISRWIAEAVAEDEVTEFKSGIGLDKGALSKTAKRQIAEELSAMANSAGGTLFLGVRTQKQDLLDVPFTREPIEDVDRFGRVLRAQLETLIGPPIPEVAICVRYAVDDKTKGYVAIKVPRSDRRPHMSRAPDLHTYFKRSATSTMPMSPYEIEDQFLRIRNAHVRGRMELQAAGSIGAARIFVGFLILENVSEVSAQNCWAAVQCEGMEFASERQANFGFTVGPRVPKGRTFYAQSHILIPPSGTTAVCAYKLYLAKDADGNVEVRQPDSPRERAARRPETVIEYGCLNTKPQTFGRKLNDEELEDLFDSGKLVVD